MRQMSLIKHSNSFGGELLKGKRKTYRPLSSKRPLHLVLKSQEVLKMGSFMKHKKLTERLINIYAKKFNITIYDYAICSNHIHFTLRFFGQREFQNFLRLLCGQIAQQIQGLGGMARASRSFWLHRPFTRVIHWGRDFKRTLNYMAVNWFEADGRSLYRKQKSKQAALLGFRMNSF